MPPVSCPHCSCAMATLPELAGKIVSCPHCGGQLTMPGDPAPVPEGTRILPFHVAPTLDTPLPPVQSLPVVDWDGPLDALAIAAKLGREGRLPTEPGVTFHLRIVIGESDGRLQALRVPLTPETTGVRIDWRPAKRDLS